jgi:hypothetical protein
MKFKAHSHKCEYCPVGDVEHWRLSWARGTTSTERVVSDRNVAMSWCSRYGVVFPEPATFKQPKTVQQMSRRLKTL